MKSSSSNGLLRKNTKSAVNSWNPIEFELPAAQAPQVSVEDILDIFMGPAGNDMRKTRGSSHDRAVFSAFETSDIASWMPDQEYVVPEYGQPQRSVRPFGSQPRAAQQQNQQQFSRKTSQEAPRKKDVQKMQFEAEKKAKSVLIDAQEQADQLIAQAQQEAEAIIAQAHEQLNEAMENARQMALQEVEEETRTILQTVNGMLDQVSAWKEEVTSQSQGLVVDIIKDIAQSMFSSGLVLNQEQLQQNLNRIMDNAQNIGNIKLYLNPVDAGKLDPYWREFQASMTGSMVQVIPSDEITPGGCFIHGEMGNVDARLETQMRSIMNTLQSDFS